MSDKSSASAAESAAGASSTASTANAGNASSSGAASKGPAPQGNPAFRMMGLPRLRLPSRNWLIFLSITGSFASAVIYDKYQTRRNREKWCKLVSHIPNEYLPTNMMPRKMTVYLAAPPGDSLRSAREHFHLYVKPVLVAAAVDWDVVEGRKEGDVRYKTAERIRKKRKKAGEGEPPTEEEADMITVDGMRKEKGIVEFDGVAGDLVIGRNTWKEYVRGLHEGWLGPADPPKPPQADSPEEAETSSHSPGESSLGDAAVKAAVNSVTPPSAKPNEEFVPDDSGKEEGSGVTDDASPKEKSAEEKKKEDEEEEKPKPRQPPPYIQPSEYESATPSNHISEIIGPSIGIRYPHILGFRNTPFRIYRFLTRRNLANSVGRDVAAAVLASHRPYSTDAAGNDETLSSESEVAKVLQHEESDWWKTTFYPRKDHEESVWIEDMMLDERIVGRMRAFQLTAEDEDRAKRIWDGMGRRRLRRMTRRVEACLEHVIRLIFTQRLDI